MTKFFEPINVSATHIYHSALELCPASSIVRQLYYHQHRPITPWPRVVIGAPDSWDQSVSVSNKNHQYKFCIWSPCGRFVAAQTTEAAEIRDPLTFELLTTLQPTETVQQLMGPLAYSPDGRSLACGSNTSIVIWDIQTGGVAYEVQCGLGSISMVWSLNGKTVGFIDLSRRVHTHDLSSGITTSPGEFSSTSDPYFWAHDKTFRILTTVPSGPPHEGTVDILEVGHTLAKIYSFSLMRGIMLRSTLNTSYSPATCRLAISADRALQIFDNWNSIFWSQESGSISFHCFSHDGNLFAAIIEERICVWKYTSRFYTRWKEFRCQGRADFFLQFSSAQLSILGRFEGILYGWRLHDLPTTPTTDRRQFASISRSGNYIATAYESETTVTIIDLRSQTPSQSIDSDVEIEGLALTGNILLVFGSVTVVAWLLTKEGMVDGVFRDGRASRMDSIWTTSLLDLTFRPEFKVEGHLGMISCDGQCSPRYFIYHIETGEILGPDEVPRCFSSPWKHLKEVFTGRDYLGFYDPSRPIAPPEDCWQTSETTLREGWVKDAEGKHRLWVPVKWRASWDLADWCHNIVTQFSIFGGKTVVIKF